MSKRCRKVIVIDGIRYEGPYIEINRIEYEREIEHFVQRLSKYDKHSGKSVIATLADYSVMLVSTETALRAVYLIEEEKNIPPVDMLPDFDVIPPEPEH